MTIQNFKLFRDKCYINGEWIEANSKDKISVNNPASLKEIGLCQSAVKRNQNAIEQQIQLGRNGNQPQLENDLKF